MHTITRSELIDMLNRACSEAGSRKAFAASAGISPQYLTDVLMFRRDPGAKVLTALGLEKVVTYRRATR